MHFLSVDLLAVYLLSVQLIAVHFLSVHLFWYIFFPYIFTFCTSSFCTSSFCTSSFCTFLPFKFSCCTLSLCLHLNSLCCCSKCRFCLILHQSLFPYLCLAPGLWIFADWLVNPHCIRWFSLSAVLFFYVSCLVLGFIAHLYVYIRWTARRGRVFHSYRCNIFTRSASTFWLIPRNRINFSTFFPVGLCWLSFTAFSYC